MSRAIHQPVASIKLTNVATIRLNKGGKRFELACYKNKILDYRQGLENDLDEVLQSERIFVNVSKGQFANSSDLKECFPECNSQEEMIRYILTHGQSLQISDLERNQRHENLLAQIATWLSTNCIHSESAASFTSATIKHHLTNFNIQTHKPLKQQYLAALKYLQQNNILPICRAAMELQWTYDSLDEESVLVCLNQLNIVAKESPLQPQQQLQQQPPQQQRTFVIDPASYRVLHQTSQTLSHPNALEILQSHVQAVVVQQNNNNEKDNNDSSVAVVPEPPTQTEQQATSEEDDDDEAYLVLANQSRKTKKNARKQQKKALRRLQRQQAEDDDDDDNSASSAEEQDLPAPSQPQKKAQSKKKKKKRQQRQQQKNESTVNPESMPPTSNNGRDATTTTTTPTTSTNEPTDNNNNKTLTCNTCVGSSFGTAAEFRQHFRSDWHRYNLKLKLKQIPAVSQDEFVQCDAQTFFTNQLE